MKHIFTVFSHITFYVAHSIIQSEKFDIKDCVLLTGRKYKIPSQYNDIYTNVVDLCDKNAGRYFKGCNIVGTIINRRKYDRMIDTLVNNDDYYAYIGGGTDDGMNLLVSKKNCKAYYLMEEGAADYVLTNPRRFTGFRYWVYKLALKNLFPRFYLLKENHFTISAKFKGFYGSEKAFPLFPDYPKKIIDIHLDNVDLGFTPNAVFSVDALFVFLEPYMVEEIYSQLAKFFAKKQYNTVAYKFHPFFEINPDMKKKYSEMISNNFSGKWIELDSNSVLENILYTYKCDFYSGGSSVQIYGAMSGAHCYAFTKLVHKYTTALYDNSNLKDFVEEIEFEEEF